MRESTNKVVVVFGVVVVLYVVTFVKWIFLVAEVTVCCSCKILIYTQMYLTTGRTEPIPLVMKEDTLCLGRLKSEVFSFLAFRQSKLKVNSKSQISLHSEMDLFFKALVRV